MRRCLIVAVSRQKIIPEARGNSKPDGCPDAASSVPAREDPWSGAWKDLSGFKKRFDIGKKSTAKRQGLPVSAGGIQPALDIRK
jgi:hypothetical protein